MNSQTTSMILTGGGVRAAVRDLRRGFRGRVILPGDEGYDAGRAAFRPYLDPRPAVVAEAVGPADVRAAVRAARDHDLPFAVQATGHGTVVPSDGGILLRTGRMSGVLVDPDRRIARAGPGARWGEVVAAAAPFGLAPLSGDAMSVGVAGYTLGGGRGWLSRKYGYAADSLLRADIVTADGRQVTARADHNADLFWAVRGGGGNFGVATALEFRLDPVSRIYAGTAYFPIERAAGLLRRYREWAGSAQPDEWTTSVVVMKEAPQAGTAGPAVAVRGLYAGSAAGGARALRPLLAAAGRPLHDGFRAMTYADSGTVGGTAPRQFHLLAGLPDDAIDAIVTAAGHRDAVANAVEFRQWGGALARPSAGAGPIGHRDVPFSVSVDGPPEAAAALLPYVTGGSFVNFLSDPGRARDAYTAADYRRLQAVKRAYDPGNLFRLNHNIPPTDKESR